MKKQKDKSFWRTPLLIMVFLSLMVIQKMHSQNYISGVVFYDQQIPIVGVNISVKGTDKGVVSDFDGNFRIEASKGDILVLSSIGFKTQVVEINDNDDLLIEMINDLLSLDEIVVVGYGTQRQIEVTGAVNFVGSELLSKSPVSDIGEALQGLVAGVNVQAPSGRPGAVANIQIRGVGSVSSTSNNPLYIVDGIPFQSVPNIAPEQIESLDILKDGAAAAIYGTRASNGVVLITTKRGEEGKMTVDFSTYLALQNITSGTPLLDTRQQFYQVYTREAAEAGGTERDIAILTENRDAFANDSDFVDEIQNSNALIKSYNLNISGGAKDLSLNLSANYFDQEGVLLNSGFNRLSTRLTGDYRKGKFKAFASIGITEEQRDQEPDNIYENSISIAPWDPPLSSLDIAEDNTAVLNSTNTTLYGTLARDLQSTNEQKTNSSNIAINLDYELLEGLNFQVNLGRNSSNFNRKLFLPQFIGIRPNGATEADGSRVDAIVQERFVLTERRSIENILKYSKDIGDHSFDLLGLASYEKFNSKQIDAGVIGLLTNDTPILRAGANAIKPNSNDFTEILTGLLARLQYNYDDRYLFSGSFRKDGSSNFGEQNRFGNFFGAALGWNISEERFFKNANLNAIDNLKIRASWAQVGNQNITPYSFSQQIEDGVNYPLGSQEVLQSGLIQRRYFDESIKWETSISTNIGLDLSMFNNRLTFTADVYRNEKEDMLLAERLPPSLGSTQTNALGEFDVRFTNAGNMVNEGIELALEYKNESSSGFKWGVSGTFAKNENTVTNLNGIQRGYGGGKPVLTNEDRIDNTTFLAEGFEAGAFFLLQNNGVIKTQEQLDEYILIDPSAQLGDIQYIDQPTTVDANGNPIGDGQINEEDRIYAGSGQPDFEAGLNFNLAYKGFDFFVQNYLFYGAEIYNGSKLFAYQTGRHADLFYQWTPQNANSDIPTDRDNRGSNNVRARSDYFLEDGSFLRIRNITLGYSIPQTHLPKFVTKFRLYATAQNPITITNYTGYDPEVGGNGLSTRGVDRGNYPVARRFLFGAQLSF